MNDMSYRCCRRRRPVRDEPGTRGMDAPTAGVLIIGTTKIAC